jgi:antitoxin PrlF
MGRVVVTRMSSKGQIVVPLTIRKMLDLKVGELFALIGRGDTIILKKIKVPSDTEFEALMKWGEKFARTQGITRDDVNDAIRQIRAKKKCA